MNRRLGAVAGLLLAVIVLLPGCAPLVIAGAGTAAVAAHDRRTLGAFVDDQTIELRAGAAIKSDESLKRDAHINVTSMNGVVLLSGECSSAELRDRALSQVRTVDGVRRIVNEIRIAPASSWGSRTHDTWLTTKVKTKLIHTEGIDSTRVKVVSENDAVYLMGLVSRREAGIAADAATTVAGVSRVVKLFEYID